jgi:cyclopropane fatty-acyl-phospholipid synthase-like methyltransferase
MLSSAVKSWFGRTPATPVTLPVVAKPAPVPQPPMVVPPPRTPWPAARLAVTDRLWGPGFGFPGGEVEGLRLTRSLGLSPATSLLLVGGGGGGAACAMAREFGAWVAAREKDAELVTAAQGLITQSQLGRKVSMALWEPDQPVFEVRKYHHCVAFEPLAGQHVEPILDGLARTLKPAGQLVMMDLAAAAPLDPADRRVARWAKLERRDPARLIAPDAVTGLLGRVHLDVRIAEDVSDRHLEQVVEGWRALLHDLPARRPDPVAAAYLVAEAELWLLRVRLIKEGRLRMMRWQAISQARPV